MILPIFTILGKFLPPLDFINGIGSNTWLAFGYIVLIIAAPLAAFLTGTLLTLKYIRNKVAVILCILASILVAFMVYLFTMFFGFFATGFFDAF